MFPPQSLLPMVQLIPKFLKSRFRNGFGTLRPPPAISSAAQSENALVTTGVIAPVTTSPFAKRSSCHLHLTALRAPLLGVVAGIGAQQFADSLTGRDDRRRVQAAGGAG